MHLLSLLYMLWGSQTMFWDCLLGLLPLSEDLL